MDILHKHHSLNFAPLPVVSRKMAGGKLLAFLNRLRFWRSWKTWQKALALLACGASLAGCGLVTIGVILLIGIGCETGYLTCTAGASMVTDPPASELANFNAAHASMRLTLTNTHLVNHTGNVNIKIADEQTGNVIGQKSFGYVINGNIATFTDPSAATTWVRSFSNYGGDVKVTITASGTKISNPPLGQHGDFSAVVIYKGSPYTSASKLFAGSGPKCHRGPGGTKICPQPDVEPASLGGPGTGAGG